ncbi:DinB family protein [Chloroflexota bacterium]
MKKEQLIHKIEKAWEAFQTSTEGLSEREMLTPGVIGEWSVCDIIAHVTVWEEEALKALPIILAGERLPRYSDLYGGIDAFNAQMTEKNRSLSLEEVLRRRDETHQRLLTYVRSAPQEHITTESRFRRRLRYDSYSHYPEHTEAILKWRGGKA